MLSCLKTTEELPEISFISTITETLSVIFLKSSLTKSETVEISKSFSETILSEKYIHLTAVMLWRKMQQPEKKWLFSMLRVFWKLPSTEGIQKAERLLPYSESNIKVPFRFVL